MLLVVTAAFALDCAEVVNMEAAGVPAEEIIRQMNVSGTPVDAQFISCMAAWGVEETLVNSAWRLEGTRPRRDVEVLYDHRVEASSWLELDVTCGSVTVHGAKTGRISLEGHGGEGARLVAVPSSKGVRLQIEGPSALDSSNDPAEIPRFSRGEKPKVHPAERPCADLNVTVPHDSRVVVKSSRADIRVWNVDGPLELTTHFGNMDVVGSTNELVLKTASGNIHADTGAQHVDVETVSGMVDVSMGPEARVVAESISGPLWLWGGPIQRLDANSVSGDIRLNAAILDAGNVRLVTHKGDVEALVPSGEVSVSSHEGLAWGPTRMVRPDGPTQRVGVRNPVPVPPQEFSGLNLLSAEVYGVWAKGQPERWWFRTGAVISAVIPLKVSGYSMEASSFSGDVRVRTGERFPGATGPVIAGLEAVSDRLEACARAQHQRTPSVTGHAVVTMQIGTNGEVTTVHAPAKASAPAAVQDGQFSACLVRAVEKLTFPASATTELRWPVPFRAPLDVELLASPVGSLAPSSGSPVRKPDSRRVPYKRR